MFDKNGFLWLDLEYPNVLNIFVVLTGATLTLIFFGWVALWLIHVLPWPS